MSLQNVQSKPDLKYTICFILREDKVLMLYRSREPNKNRWNGVGGKIESGETPLASMQREIHEEVGVNIPASKLHFGGTVIWEIPNKPTTGMYTFIVHIKEKLFKESKNTPEGLLQWKELSWVLDRKNDNEVTNIPYFLRPMLKNQTPMEYIFTYDQERHIQNFTTQTLRAPNN